MVSKVTPDTMLSASRLPAVMGLSPYRSANDELQYSINALKGGEREDIGNESMAWGNHLEPVILLEAARRLELSSLVTEHPEARYHTELPLCCSLDGTADGRGQVISNDPDRGIFVIGKDSIKLDGIGVIEAKLTALAPEETPALHRGPVQLQGQMDIVGAKWGVVAVLYQGTKLRVFLFEPHSATLDAIAAAAKVFQGKLDFWKKNDSIDFYPPKDSGDANRMWPQASEEAIHLSEGAERLVNTIVAAKLAADKAEESRLTAEAELKTMLGSHSKGLTGSYQVNWPMRQYKAQQAKNVPAKEAYSIRQTNLTIKELTK